jgi:hypothetical protein
MLYVTPVQQNDARLTTASVLELGRASECERHAPGNTRIWANTTRLLLEYQCSRLASD